MSVEACVLLHLRKRAVARAPGAAALLWLGRDVALVHLGLAWSVVELTPKKALAALLDEHGALAKLHDDERGFFFVPDTFDEAPSTYAAAVRSPGSGVWIRRDAQRPAPAEEWTYDEGKMQDAARAYLVGTLSRRSPYFRYFDAKMNGRPASLEWLPRKRKA